MRHWSINRYAEQGFTIVELVVVMIVAGIIATLIFTSLDDFYNSNSAVISQTVQVADTRAVLRTIEADITGSPGFVTSLAATAPTGMNNDATAWNYQTNDSSNPSNRRVLIARMYGTDKAPDDTTRQLQFVQSGVCDTVNGTPFQNYYVYFVALDTGSGLYNLYRRTMIGSGTPCPGTLFQKQSCAVSVIAANPSVCKATDAVLLHNVASFSVDYYLAATDQSPIADQYGGGSASVATAKSVVLSVSTNRSVNGTTIPYTSSLRMSRLN